jgi:hypothetical protein
MLRRCDGCQFYIEETDVSVMSEGPHHHHLNLNDASVDDAANLNHELHFDDFSGAPVSKTSTSLPRQVTRAVGTAPRFQHDTCAAVTAGRRPGPHPANWRAFEPSKDEEVRRRRWYLRHLEIRSKPAWFDLPQMLSGVTTGPLFREIAAFHAESLLEHCDARDDYFNIDKPLWIRWVEFEGRLYMREIRNTPVPGQPPSHVPREGLTTIYYAENYLGIVDIYFSTTESRPNVPYSPDIYWRTLEAPGADGEIRAVSDGVKMRSLVSLWEDGRFGIGSLLMPTQPMTRLAPLRQFPAPTVTRTERLETFRFNEPETVGYSFCWNKKLVAVHAHKTGMDRKQVYARQPNHGPAPVWQYVPVGYDEYITGIWHTFHTDKKNAYLAIVTSKGRMHHLGAHVNRQGRASGWIAMHHVREYPSQVHYKAQAASIDVIAFESPTDYRRVRDTEPMRIPDAPFAPAECPSDFFYSVSRMNEVVEITPSYHTCQGVDVIGGVLLDFLDGHRETLGKVRLDRLGDKMDSEHAQELWVRFGKVAGRYPNVVELRLGRPRRGRRHRGGHLAKVAGRCEPVSAAGPSWLRIPLYEMLEWWFSDSATILRWEGRRSPLFKAKDVGRLMALSVLNAAPAGDGDPGRSPEADEEEEDLGNLEDPWARMR